MSPVVVLRAAEARDVPRIVEFWAEAGENSSRPADRSDLVARLLDRDSEALIIATLDDRIVGTIIAGWDGWRGSLYRLAVDPAHRGRSIARSLVSAGERRLADLGAERVTAMVLDENAGGADLWTALGYERQADWSRWVRHL